MFEIYSKTDCGFCVQAKMLLDRIGETYTEINIEQDIEKYRKWMREELGVKTVPQIFYRGVYIGGFEALQDHLIDNDFI